MPRNVIHQQSSSMTSASLRTSLDASSTKGWSFHSSAGRRNCLVIEGNSVNSVRRPSMHAMFDLDLFFSSSPSPVPTSLLALTSPKLLTHASDQEDFSSLNITTHSHSIHLMTNQNRVKRPPLYVGDEALCRPFRGTFYAPFRHHRNPLGEIATE